jgi:ABC-type nitrate/sulfonate/bicarbonate transport system substrate-binding protein
MKIIDFEIADNNLTKVTIVTEPRVSEKVFDVAQALLKNMNFPPPSLHQGKLVFANAARLKNPAIMSALTTVLDKAEKEINDAREAEERRRAEYLNQFRQAAGLPAK